MAARKKKTGRRKQTARKKKGTWGGRREGAGRPKGSGKGPSPLSRRNRVAVMLSDVELAKLERIAQRSGTPIATAAYKLIAAALPKR